MTNKKKIGKLKEAARECLPSNMKIDSYDNILWEEGGRKNRYHFKKNVMNHQVKSGDRWVRVRSYPVSKLTEDLLVLLVTSIGESL